jgi:ATP-dependent Clp protease ATP-binding subunit ClpC
MEIKDVYSSELKKILLSLSSDIIKEYPAKKITTEHFMFAIFSDRECLAYKILNNITNSFIIKTVFGLIDEGYDFYASYLHDNSRPIPPSKLKDISCDPILSKILKEADEERIKLADEKLDTSHFLLSIINSKDKISKPPYFSDPDFYKFCLNERKELEEKESGENNKVNVLDLSTIIGIKPKSSKKSNVIDNYCVNLNELARKGKIDDLIGRQKEINRLIRVIGRRNKNNAILVGLQGTGKTCIIQGIAKRIEEGKAMFLNGKIILQLNMAAVIAGTTYRGMLEERMNNIISEIKDNKDYILFIDDIHNFLSNNSGNSSEISGILSNALSSGDVQMIATTSFKEYKNTVESNPTLSRRFQKIIIEPSSIEDTEIILMSSKQYYEKYHNVKYTDEAIKVSVYLANKYITERKLPDSAIDIIDECGSEMKPYNSKEMDKLSELKKELENYETLRDRSYEKDEYTVGDTYKEKYKEISAKIIDFEKKLKYSKKNNAKIINDIDIYNTVSNMTGIPLTKLSVSEKEKYLNIESILNSSVVGQEDAIGKVSKAIKRTRVGLDKKGTPNGVFLFCGTSGCGKTFLAKKLADEFYAGSLVRFDMSEYSDKTSSNKLYGSSSGYVGYDQGGLLTEAVKNKPYCVLLLDEIEKADKDVLNTFLQVFDEGFLTDNTGYRVSFKNTMIIMTSNIGSKDSEKFGRSAGFTQNVDENKKEILEKSLHNFFSPEFLNRIDNVIYFNKLNNDDFKKIISIELDNLNKRLNELKYKIEFTDDVINFIFDLVIKDKTIGARKISRIIQNEIENVICDLYLKNENKYTNDYTFSINVEDNKINIK